VPSEPSETPGEPAGESYGARLATLAAEAPDRPALICGDAVWTRAEFDRRANRLARAYAGRGLGAGDRATVALGNGLEFFAACLGVWRLGAVPNPISARLPEPERRNLVQLANPRLLIGFEPESADGRAVIPADHEPDGALPDDPLPDVIAPNERAMASGGSTGVPKLIVAANPAVYDEAFASAVFRAKRTVLVPGPLYHAAPWSSAWQGLLAGCTVVVMPRFDAEETLRLIERHRVDRMGVVPTMLHRIWRLPPEVRERYDTSSLDFVMTGGAPCPPWLMRRFIEWWGADVMNEAFGPSERIGGTFINGRQWLEHPGSVGLPVGGAKLRILDAEGRPCAPGEMGEIYMMPAGGPGSTYRYVGADAQKTPDGYESVGDMGYLDEDGYLYLGDRKSDMILCAGRNVYPAEIEGALAAHPAVRSSAVIGLPDDDLGQAIHAIVECDAGSDEAALREMLRDWLAERLVHYKRPRSYEFTDQPLRDDAGKLRRAALREARIAGP